MIKNALPSQTDRRTDRQTNIMAIARRFVLKNASRAKNRSNLQLGLRPRVRYHVPYTKCRDLWLSIQTTLFSLHFGCCNFSCAAHLGKKGWQTVLLLSSAITADSLWTTITLCLPPLSSLSPSLRLSLQATADSQWGTDGWLPSNRCSCQENQPLCFADRATRRFDPLTQYTLLFVFVAFSSRNA